MPEIGQIKDNYSSSEDLLRDRLINHMIILWAVTGGIGFAILEIRALEIGWTSRDFIQFLVISSMIVIALCHRKLSTHLKAISLILCNLLIGTVGVYTLGMFSGGIFFFPFTAVIMVLFFSTRSIAIFSLLSILFLCLIATGFTSGLIKLRLSADLLLTSYANWGVYIICISFFFLIICKTILNYRRLMRQLIDDVIFQRDELDKNNKDLQRAFDEIKMLRGILPLCSFCKKIRDDKGYWEQIDVYIHKYSEADISHSICPECMKKHYPELE